MCRAVVGHAAARRATRQTGATSSIIARLARATSAIVLARKPDSGALRETEGFDALFPALAEVIKAVIAVSAAAGEASGHCLTSSVLFGLGRDGQRRRVLRLGRHVPWKGVETWRW